jgi:antitoxin (DNA-binding transcriptional repressor) of toxin-antitoxin stability system
MTTLSLENAASQLPDVIHRLGAGEEVLIADGDRVVARLVREETPAWQRPKPGLGKGMLTVASDDDDHLQDFAEYMP